jgi:flagellar biosynthesis protein FlhB
MVILYTEREHKLRQITKEEENEKKKAESAVRIKRKNDVIAQVIFTESVLTFVKATNVVILNNHHYSIHFYTYLILDSSIRISFAMS